jgi:hypothetical protein
MNVSEITKSAKAFDLAADRCCEERPLPENKIQMLAVPAVVCRAFAAEVGLKALICEAGGTGGGHDLARLFRQLPRNVRDSLIAATGLSQTQFQTELDGVAHAFIEWRYVYETDSRNINFNFLTNFEKAIIGLLPSSEDA